MKPIPLFVELCAGTAALSLRLQGGKHARPPVSRMGNKQGYAGAILRTLGLRSGQGADRYLWCEPDAGCRLLLTSYTDADLRTRAAEIIRGWADEDPRGLWERLRAEGPVRGPEAREVARWMRIVTANRLIPVHYERGRWCNSARNTGAKGGISFGGDDFCTPVESLASVTETLPTLPASIHPDARPIDPREVARWLRLITSNRLINLDGNWQNTGQGGSTFGGDAFSTPLPALLDALRATTTAPGVVLPDARPLEPHNLPPGCVVYIDPPYLGHLEQEPTTGYGNDLSRDEVCEMAERWASAGARVVISESAPLVELDGWHQVEITGERRGQKRVFSKQQREFLTMNRPPRWTPAVQSSLWGAAWTTEPTMHATAAPGLIPPPGSIKDRGMPTDTTDRLCRELRGLKEALGLSNAEAGRRCDPPMTGQQWGRIEKGQASTVRQFERCFAALGASLNITVIVAKAD